MGSIVFSYVNESAASVVFTGTVDGLDPASIDTTVAPGASDTDTRTPLADGTYDVTIAEDGVSVFTETLTVACVIPGTPSAAIGDIECIAGGTIEILLTVTGGTVAEDFTIAVNGENAPNQPVTIPADSSATASVGPFADGTYQITATADGTTLLILSLIHI